MLIVLENPYKSIVVQGKDEQILVSEGNKIQFVAESGEIKTGYVTKLQGKDEKVKIQMMPEKGDCEEIWDVSNIVSGSLEVIK